MTKHRHPSQSLLGVLFASLAVVCSGIPDAGHATGNVVVVESGPLRGSFSEGARHFLGIPYAAPPIGTLRWKPPQPRGRWHGVLDASQFGSPCPQLDFFGNAFGEENCLYLNVYTPGIAKKTKRASRGLPVMVWIHGGSLVTGAGSDYDPTPLVKKGLVVVTINYRLGLLGFFAQSALDTEGHTSGNYGLMDQQQALRWVRRNIGAFGGDPTRVTIFGESAGGLSVYSQLASPTAAGLFQRAISQSGAYASFQSYLQSIIPIADAELGGAGLASALGCGSQTAECLRAVAATALLMVQPGIVNPVVDGTILNQPPDAAFASGQFNRVPVISGSNRDEYRLFVILSYDYAGAPLTDADYPAAVGALFGLPPTDPFVQFVLSLYPLSNFLPPPGVASAPLALGAVGTDFAFSCPARKAALSLSQHVPTYVYEFADENAPLSLGLVPGTFPLGAYHAAEIQYLLNVFAIPAAFTAEQTQLSDTMIRYWAHFARTGNPNTFGAPTWSRYNAATDQVQAFRPPAAVPDDAFDAVHQCSSFWDTF